MTKHDEGVIRSISVMCQTCGGSTDTAGNCLRPDLHDDEGELVERSLDLVPATVESHTESPWAEIIELAQEITTLKAQVTDYRQQYEAHVDLAGNLRDEIESLAAENAKLREVINETLKELMDQGPELVLVIPSIVNKLRAALTEKEGE